jgi:hypothetical protein
MRRNVPRWPWLPAEYSYNTTTKMRRPYPPLSLHRMSTDMFVTYSDCCITRFAFPKNKKMPPIAFAPAGQHCAPRPLLMFTYRIVHCCIAFGIRLNSLALRIRLDLLPTCAAGCRPDLPPVRSGHSCPAALDGRCGSAWDGSGFASGRFHFWWNDGQFVYPRIDSFAVPLSANLALCISDCCGNLLNISANNVDLAKPSIAIMHNEACCVGAFEYSLAA